MNLVTPKAVVKARLQREFVKYLCQIETGQQSVTKFIDFIVMNLVTPKAIPNVHIFVPLKSNLDVQQASHCLMKSSCLVPALGMTKFANVREIILVVLCCDT
jgi:hypothetical protein